LESSNHVEHHRTKKLQSWYVHTLCAFKSIQITNLSSTNYFRMIPFAVSLFYCKLSTSITSKFSWITSPLFKFKYEDLSIFLHRLILFLFSLFISTIVNPMIIASYQISSKQHLDITLIQYKIYLNPVYQSHTYSNYNCVNWVNGVVSQSLVLFYLCSIVILSSHHIPIPHVSNRIFEPYFQVSLIHIQYHALLILFTCIELFNRRMS
jgi:hypothetical protein